MGINEENIEITQRITSLLSQRVSDVKETLEAIGIPEGTYYRSKKTHWWKAEHLFGIAQYFKVSLDWLIFGNTNEVNLAPDKPQRKIPVLGYASCGNSPVTWQEDATGFLELAGTEHLSNPFIITARGDSMKPYIEPGDKLLCADMPDRIKEGSAVVVGFKSLPDTYDATAKLISFDKRNGLIVLTSINTRFLPKNYKEDDINKIYKLVKIIRDVK